MGKFVAFVKKEEKMRMVCKAGKHEMRLDEPVDEGGTDLAMNPVEALLSALGACKCITAWDMAERCKIKLIDIEYEVSGETVSLERVGDVMARGFKSITSKVRIKADNSKEEIDEFLKKVDIVCPVGNTLVRNTECISEVEYL